MTPPARAGRSRRTPALPELAGCPVTGGRRRFGLRPDPPKAHDFSVLFARERLVPILHLSGRVSDKAPRIDHDGTLEGGRAMNAATYGALPAADGAAVAGGADQDPRQHAYRRAPDAAGRAVRGRPRRVQDRLTRIVAPDALGREIRPPRAGQGRLRHRPGRPGARVAGIRDRPPQPPPAVRDDPHHRPHGIGQDHESLCDAEPARRRAAERRQHLHRRRPDRVHDAAGQPGRHQPRRRPGLRHVPARAAPAGSRRHHGRRDSGQETAEVGVRAALVGRLLLSTLHTNDATGATLPSSCARPPRARAT